MNPRILCSIITTAKIQNQPNCPLMDEWIKSVWSAHIQWIRIQSLKKGKFAICNNMDEP